MTQPTTCAASPIPVLAPALAPGRQRPERRPRLSGVPRRVPLLAGLLALLNVVPTLAAPSPEATATEGPAEGLAAARARVVSDLAALRFDRLGNPITRWDHIPPVYAPREAPHQLLVVLVDFPDRGFERFKDDAGKTGAASQGQQLAAHYQAALFDPEYAQPNTLSHYYREQSLGAYHLQGRVLPPVTLSKPRAEYGRSHRPEGGDWRNDRDPEGMVEETLALVAKQHPDLDWSAFDRWDPTDWDGDGVLAEPDGYLDHFVIVFAGNGQSSCHGLFQLQRKLDPNAGPEVLTTLSAPELECVDRLWPHRFLIQKRTGEGPQVEGRRHTRGGAPVLAERLWAQDYNMQSEYTDASTFIHEFGHSIGLPDIYSRTSNNSTGPWEVMSHTTAPRPQNLSAWSRLMLGWLRPAVILPPEAGGKKQQSVYLQTLDDPAPAPEATLKAAATHAHERADRAALVVLPPKTRAVHLARPAQGQFALYSGQGNQLDRTAELALDLSAVKAGAPAEISFAVWHDIEGGWDFAYAEVSTHDPARGEAPRWTRLRPRDPAQMPAKHGHDGKNTLPGFTGLSGDRDGDGKNESAPGCDPKAPLAHGEDKAGAALNPCLTATWIRAHFDLSPWSGGTLRFRLRYFTDMAAVQPGLLIDDVRVRTGAAVGRALPAPRAAGKNGRGAAKAAKAAKGPAAPGAGESPVAAAGGITEFDDDFEAERRPRNWKLDGFERSPGHHTLVVPHYYLLEYRDPYGRAGSYDRGIGESASLRLFWDVKLGRVRGLRVRPRPGVVAWYFDGAYAWSENDPATNGPGRGSLLALDAWPNETPIPGLEDLSRGRAADFDTRYDLGEAAAQPTLRDAFRHTMCFVRNAAYRPVDLTAAELGGPCPTATAGATGLAFEGKSLLYGYEKVNAHLPGPERDAFAEISELYDYKPGRAAGTGPKPSPAVPPSWRLRDRSLRFTHTFDAPFALEDFADGLEVYDLKDGQWVRSWSAPHPAVRRFSDATPTRWLNRHLPFGGVAVPDAGFQFELVKPKPEAPKGARVKVYLNWD